MVFICYDLSDLITINGVFLMSAIGRSSLASGVQYANFVLTEEMRGCLTRWVHLAPSREDLSKRATVASKIVSFLYQKDENDLDLSGLELTSLPAVFGFEEIVRRLKTLDLSNNLFVKFPLEIESLRNLEALDLSDNFELESIPLAVRSLVSLRKLELFQDRGEYEEVHGQFATIDAIDLEGLAGLDNLEELVLSGYEMTEVPGVIYECRSLKNLTITNTGLKSIPAELCNRCQGLTHLDLSCNDIQEIPRGISSFTHLRDLDLSSNQDLDTFSYAIFNLQGTCKVNLKETALTSHHIELIQGRVSISGYDGPVIHLPELKEENSINVPEGRDPDPKRPRFSLPTDKV